MRHTGSFTPQLEKHSEENYHKRKLFCLLNFLWHISFVQVNFWINICTKTPISQTQKKNLLDFCYSSLWPKEFYICLFAWSTILFFTRSLPIPRQQKTAGLLTMGCVRASLTHIMNLHLTSSERNTSLMQALIFACNPKTALCGTSDCITLMFYFHLNIDIDKLYFACCILHCPIINLGYNSWVKN